MTLRGGRYELLDTIASGGMATVHLGRAVGAGGFERLVAVKTMHPHLSSEPEFVSMFFDEARLTARIRHPNVVGTIDIQQDELGLFLVMEYVEGPSMSQVVRALGKQKTTLPMDIVLRVMFDVLAGLHAAHESCGPTGEPLNVVHRDVSPHNILVGIDGIARIMDFGVARAEARMSSTRAGDVKGKINYMAPEQARMDEMDRRVDVYAAGVVLWEFLTGRRLIRGENDLIAMNQIFHAEHPAPHELEPAVPQALSEIVMRAIARDKNERFPTTAAFAETLDQVVKTNGLTVATQRTLGAFVRELNLHKSPSDLPSGSRSLPAITAPPPSLRTGASVTGATIPSAITPTLEAPTTSTESRGGFASSPPAAARAPATRMIIAAAVGGALVMGLVSWFVLDAKDKPSESTATAATSATPSAAMPTEPKPIVVPTATIAATTAPRASASAAKTAAPPPRTTTVSTGGPKSPKTFVPKEL